MMEFVSGPGEEGRQDKRFGFNARGTYGKARRAFCCKSCKIRSTAGAATAICWNLGGEADSGHSWYLRFVLLLYRTLYISTSNDFYSIFLSCRCRRASRRLCGESWFHSSTPLEPTVRCGRPSCWTVKEADTEAYSAARIRERRLN